MRKTGKTPNLHWNSISQDLLRMERLYCPLPPVQQVHLSSNDSYRYFLKYLFLQHYALHKHMLTPCLGCRMVRQDTELWTQLHRGVLTTGKLNACLGFYEAKAARRLKIGRGFVDHNKVLCAWRHLQDVPYIARASHAPSLPQICLEHRIAVCSVPLNSNLKLSAAMQGYQRVSEYNSGITIKSVSKEMQRIKAKAKASAGEERRSWVAVGSSSPCVGQSAVTFMSPAATLEGEACNPYIHDRH